MEGKYMRGIAALGNGEVELVRDVPVPEIGPYEALIRMKTCGFCNGTDFHIIRGEMPVTVDSFPTLLGHEGVGDIVELGSKVRNYKVGDRILNPIVRIMPGTRYGCTWGAMCDYALVQDDRRRSIRIRADTKAIGVRTDSVRFRSDRRRRSYDAE